MPEILRSGYLDGASWRLADPAAPSVAAALGLRDVRPVAGGPGGGTLVVGISVERANDPSALLALPWAERQKAIQELTEAGTLWTTYGGKAADLAAARATLATHGRVLTAADGYVDTDTRTVWVQLGADGFKAIFGREMLRGTNSGGGTVFFWEGNLSSDGVGVPVGALQFDIVQAPTQAASFGGAAAAAVLRPGPQGIGNATGAQTTLFPNGIAERYEFLQEQLAGVRTGTVGIVSSSLGAEFGSSDIQGLIDSYRATAGAPGTGSVTGGPVGRTATSPGAAEFTERALDIGIVSTVVPNSDIVLYRGGGSTFRAVQGGIWDRTNDVPVLSASYTYAEQASPGSPFHRSYEELAIDAALRGVTLLYSSGDRGSGGTFGNGVPTVSTGSSSEYALVVGGTSLTTARGAASDITLTRDGLLERALTHDLGTLSLLVAGGLKHLPVAGSGDSVLIETAWNTYRFDASTGTINYRSGVATNYHGGAATSGGVDPTRPQPGYQTDFGLSIVGAGPFHEAGRGRPDVSALAGGGMNYVIPGDGFGSGPSELQVVGGTSASAPLWASLMAQIGTVFADQGLPPPGYANDLLYQVAAVAPGAFNDVRLGNNVSTFRFGGDGSIHTGTGDQRVVVTPTGFGYEAGAGYDLATGLGSPNGLLLARAMTAVAHAQTNAAEDPGGTVPGVLSADHRASAADQHLLVQSLHAGPVTLSAGGESLAFGGAPSPFAWTNAMAQKVLQSDFDPGLVRLFDGLSQAAPHTLALTRGETIAIGAEGGALAPHRVALTNEFGFAGYRGAGGEVTLARPVAVAETALGGNLQEAVVRIRANTDFANSLDFYRVDDLNGGIGGIDPGQEGYAAAAATRLYRTAAGGSTVKATAGQGYTEAVLTGIDHGDLVAARLFNGTDTFWAFAAANERGADGRPVTHLWNYGLNTWGWEDLRGGGDQDFNDMIFQIDFTSASGSGWLM